MLEEKSHVFRRLSFPSSGRRELTPDCRNNMSNAFANDARCASSITSARDAGSPSTGMKPTANYSGFASPIASYSGYHLTTPLSASRGVQNPSANYSGCASPSSPSIASYSGVGTPLRDSYGRGRIPSANYRGCASPLASYSGRGTPRASSSDYANPDLSNYSGCASPASASYSGYPSPAPASSSSSKSLSSAARHDRYAGPLKASDAEDDYKRPAPTSRVADGRPSAEDYRSLTSACKRRRTN